MKPDMPPQKVNELEKKSETTDLEIKVEKLSDFDTEGYEEYNKESFDRYIKENKINVSDLLDSYLKNVDPSEKFSFGEIIYTRAFRAWLHCDIENVKKYIKNKFDFQCNSNEDFIEKYRFFNTVSFLIFENEQTYPDTETSNQEKLVFDILKEMVLKNKGSFLLNYLAKDWVSVVDKTKSTLQNQDQLDWAPYLIAPRVYAFDSRNSAFAFTNKNNLIHHSLYISDENDFEQIDDIIKRNKKENSLDEDNFSDLSKYFSVLKSKDLMLDSKNNSLDKFDLYFFRELNTGYHRDNLKEKTGIDFSKLSLIEQRYFINYLKFVDNISLEKVKNFTKKYNKDGFRTFLSIEQGGKEMGDKILVLGDPEKLPENIAKKVFEKYGQIIDNVSKITEFARSNFTKEIETSPELIQKIEETLYMKGKQLLSQVYDDIKNKKEIDSKDIEKQLDRINADTITTFAIFKQAVKNGEKLPIESIEGSVFSKKEATDISLNQQNEMLELYESNWKNHPDRNFVESLKSYFKTAFSPEENKQKNYLYTFEKDNNIRAFVRFEKQNDASFYASALNVDEASKNFGLGEAMMDEALIREAKEHILHASCRKDNPSNMRYFEKGFISRGFKKTNETEEFDLIWEESKNKDIKAKQKSQEELIGMYENMDTEGIEIKKSKDLESLHNNIPEGKSLVRCFVKNGEWYAVYETVIENYGMNLGETK